MNPRETNPAPLDSARPSASTARLLVCESSGRWAAALCRELGPTIDLVETRNVAECWERLAEAPASLLVVELTGGNADALLARMGSCPRCFPLARAVVVADRRLAGHEWLAREAGAVMFVTSPRRAVALANLARRHLASRPEPSETTTQRIWNALPWREFAQAPSLGTTNEHR